LHGVDSESEAIKAPVAHFLDVDAGLQDTGFPTDRILSKRGGFATANPYTTIATRDQRPFQGDR
jgi:hypothetical protein